MKTEDLKNKLAEAVLLIAFLHMYIKRLDVHVSQLQNRELLEKIRAFATDEFDKASWQQLKSEAQLAYDFATQVHRKHTKLEIEK